MKTFANKLRNFLKHEVILFKSYQLKKSTEKIEKLEFKLDIEKKYNRMLNKEYITLHNIH